MQTTDRKGQIIGYTYDALGNLTEKSARQNASAEKENIYTYTYNQFGQRTQMSGTDQTSDYLYDNLGRMIKETLTGGVTKEYTYDIANNRTGFVLRNGDETYPMSMQYTYDKLNRVSRITSGNILTDYTYNRNGAISSEQIGDVTTSYQYNRAGWITDLTSQTSAKTIQSHHYQYLPDGNVSAKESTVNAGTTNYSYLYDNAGRLTQEQIGSRQQAYQYDPYGNRSQMTVMDQESYSTSYTYDQNNRLLYEIKTTAAKSEQTTYQYDDNGNLSSWFKGTLEERAATPADESASYTYDAYNRLTDFSRNGSNACHYGYNGDNLRIFKDVNGYIRKKSYWDGSTLAAEIQANVVYKYYHGLTGIIFSKTASVLSGYYYKNAHGDVTAVADDNQNVTQTYTYDAFGNQLSQSNNDTNPFRYCGEYFDTESNQIYLRNRYYDTATGRFITEDPIRDGVNWYGYCGGNPVLFADPFGLEMTISLPPDKKSDDVNVALRDMFDMHKHSVNDTINVFNDRVTVHLNGRIQTYYYNIDQHGSTHGNWMNGNKMMVNAVEFAQYFGLIQTAQTSGSETYPFLIGDSDDNIAFAVPVAATVNWNLKIQYVNTPNSKIITYQEFTCNVSSYYNPEIAQPELTPTQFITYSNKHYSKKLPLFIDNGPFVHSPSRIESKNYYYSRQRRVITRMPTIAEARYSIMHKDALLKNWYSNSIQLVLP